MSNPLWDKIKTVGSSHYRASDIQPIDLLRDVTPHNSLTCLGVKALSDVIKYAFRMLTKGINESDCNKIIHYAEIAKWFVLGTEKENGGRIRTCTTCQFVQRNLRQDPCYSCNNQFCTTGKYPEWQEKEPKTP